MGGTPVECRDWGGTPVGAHVGYQWGNPCGVPLQGCPCGVPLQGCPCGEPMGGTPVECHCGVPMG